MSLVPGNTPPGFAFDGRWLPGATFGTGRPPSSEEAFSFGSAPTLNEIGKKTELRQWTLAAENRAIPVIYGRVRTGAIIANALPHTVSGTAGFVFQCVVGEGRIDSISQIRMNDQPLPGGALTETYLGTGTQPVSPLLAAAFAALPAPVTYTDTLPDIAYYVVWVPLSALSSFPRFTAVVRGLCVYDPRDGTQSLGSPASWKWSDNPALALADFVREGARYGMGKSVEWSDVAACANICDLLIGPPGQQERLRRVGIAFYEPAEIDSAADALRTYAGVWLDPQGSLMRMIADRPRTSVGALTADDVLAVEYMELSGLANLPTVVEVLWTDTSTEPWGTRKAVATHPGVLSGALPRRIQQIALPGIQTYSQAYREAVQQLNMQRLADLTLGLTVFDEAAKWQKGDVLSVTLPNGLEGKLFYIVRVTDLGFGRWRLDLREYDPAFWSDVVASEPTFDNTGGGNCTAPPAASTFAATQVNRFDSSCACTRRLRLDWTAPYYPCLDRWEVELYEGAFLVGSYALWAQYSASIETPPLTAGLAYTARVRAHASPLAGSIPPGPWTTVGPVTISNTPCAPDAPSLVWINNVRRYQTLASPPHIDDELVTVRVSAPACPVTSTEFWASYNANPSFGSATLLFSGAGHVASMTYGQYSGSIDVNGTLTFETEFVINGVRQSLHGYLNRPNLPTAIYVRFESGGVYSAPLEVKLSQANASRTDLYNFGYANNGGFTYVDVKLRTFDGTMQVPIGGRSETLTANTGGTATSNLTVLPPGQVFVDWLGGSSHRVSAELFSGGQPVSGLARWNSWRMYL